MSALRKTVAVLAKLGGYRGELKGGGTSEWSDFAGNLYYPSFINAKVRKIGDREFVYIATNGIGAWRRELPWIGGR